MPRKAGAVWEYFEVTASTEHEQRRACCRFCEHTFASNPTRMRHHLLVDCKLINSEARERVQVEFKEANDRAAATAATAALGPPPNSNTGSTLGTPATRPSAKRRRDPNGQATFLRNPKLLSNILGFEPDVPEQRVALITGGTGGIGQAAAVALAEEGWNLVLAYCNNHARATEVKESLVANFPAIKVETVSGDLTVDGTVERIFETIEVKFDNCITAYIHLAGRPPSAANGRPFSLAENMPKTSEEWAAFKEWDFFHQLYVKRFVQICENLLPLMPNYYGRIVSISAPGINGLGSVAAYYDLPGMGRASMDFLTRQYAKKLAPRGITANIMVPGYVYNSEWEAMKPFVGGEEGLNALMRQRTPMKRWGSSEEVAGLIRYLCSPIAGFVTGNLFNIDGGFHLSSG